MRKFAMQVRFALEGLIYFVKHERNGRIQFVMAILVIIAGLLTGLSAMEWVALLLCIGLVLALEMVNTSIERICAMISPGYHPMVKIIKDVAAAAVLWAALISAIVGAFVFVPHIF